VGHAAKAVGEGTKSGVSEAGHKVAGEKRGKERAKYSAKPTVKVRRPFFVGKAKERNYATVSPYANVEKLAGCVLALVLRRNFVCAE
jgi:hypothetical protein